MSYIKGYKYDIFISYAHVDNETIFGQKDGWIEQFYKTLNLLLAKRMGRMDTIKIWWDSKKLDGSRLFDKSIEDGIQHSAILLSLVSPGYLASKYCLSELELFYNKAAHEAVGLKIGDRSRILNVLLNNIHYTKWPNALKGTTGFHFHDASQSDEIGDPIDINNPQFILKIKELRDCIMGLCENFSIGHEEVKLLHPEQNKTEKGFSIFFGEVADTLRSVRKRVIIDLEQKGFNIVYGIPPPEEAKQHERRVIEELKKSRLSVHLLDEYTGREINGAEDEWFPQKQTELALQHASSKIIWVPSELDTAKAEEEKYKSFLEQLENQKQPSGKYEYIKGTKSILSQEITDIAELIKKQDRQKDAEATLSVLLDTHFSDQLYAMDIGKALLENHIQPFINPQEDDPLKNINLLADRISQVSKLIFLYGAVSRDWVFERMSAALQVIVTRNYPIDDFFIYLAPPHKNPNDISLKQKFLKISVVDNSNNKVIDKNILNGFLKNLKGEMA